jgi:hypothetical protein
MAQFMDRRITGRNKDVSHRFARLSLDDPAHWKLSASMFIEVGGDTHFTDAGV